MARLRTGLIGCGAIGPQHAAALRQLDSSDFVAVCDARRDRAERLAAQFGVPGVYTNADRMFEDARLDAVSIATPHASHCELVIRAAQHGVHAIVEKPIGNRLDDVDRAIEATERAGILFGVIFQRRWWPASQRAKTAVQHGLLGTPILGECAIHWHRPPEYYQNDEWRGRWSTEGGAVLINQTVHAIDQLQWLMGDALEVGGRWANLTHPAIDAEDNVVAWIRFASGALAVVKATTSLRPGLWGEVLIHGSTGASVDIFEEREGAVGINRVFTTVDEATRRRWIEDDRARPAWPSFHAMQLADFLAAISAGREPAVTAREGRKSLAIILAIYESGRKGGVPVPVSPG